MSDGTEGHIFLIRVCIPTRDMRPATRRVRSNGPSRCPGSLLTPRRASHTGSRFPLPTSRTRQTRDVRCIVVNTPVGHRVAWSVFTLGES